MVRRNLIWLPIVAVALPLSAVIVDGIAVISWVGHTDLEISLIVTDAATGMPIPDTRIVIETEDEGGLDKKKFTLVTDSLGVASKTFRSLCYGTRSRSRFTDSFFVEFPFSRYRVVAEDYPPTEWSHLLLDVDQEKQLQRVAPGKAKLLVPVSLQQR